MQVQRESWDSWAVFLEQLLPELRAGEHSRWPQTRVQRETNLRITDQLVVIG